MNPGLVGQAIALFALTNIDDIIVLASVCVDSHVITRLVDHDLRQPLVDPLAPSESAS